MNELISIAPASPLRQWLIDDMNMRHFSRETQRNYIRDVGRFATFLGRPPGMATAEDLRRFQVEQREAGMPVPTMNSVTIRYKDYRRSDADRQQVMRLAAVEFIRRFLLHVLPKGFHRIRHYGLLAGTTRKASIALARKLLRVASQPEDKIVDEPHDPRPACSCCSGPMIVIETFARWRQPRAPPSGAPPIRELAP